MRVPAVLVLLPLAVPAALAPGCRAQPPRELLMPAEPWEGRFVPPTSLVTSRVRLEPLAPRFTELDHAAFMGSREHLRDTLAWGEWPSANMTVEQNEQDLERHWLEFERREAYAYTVLTRDGAECVGCVYLNPPRGGTDLPLPSVRVAFWVVADRLDEDLDRHLLEELLDWFDDVWLFESATLPLLETDARRREIAQDLGLAEAGTDEGRVVYLWTRD